MPLNKLPRLRDPTKRDFVIEVKDLFLEHYKQEPDLYYQEDVRQVEEMQFILQRCIIYKRKDIKESLDMLLSMLKWRKEIRLRELTDQSFPLEYHMLGAAFVYQPDKHGNRTLYIRTQYLRSIPELRASYKEFLAYLISQVDDSVGGQTWAVIFDLTNTGWGNYDLDLLMHFLTLLREYFPVNLDYVLAINFPWVLSAAWALAKRLIPPERRDVVVFIPHTEIFTYIEEENVPDFLGGTCQREYKRMPKGCVSTVDYLLSQKDPEVSGKRLNEILKIYKGILPKEHLGILSKQVKECGRM